MTVTTIPVTVRVLDQEFRIGCPEKEREALIESASYLDRKMQEIKDTGRVTGIDKISVMAALHITHELLNSRKQTQPGNGLIPELIQLQQRAEEELGKSRQIAL